MKRLLLLSLLVLCFLLCGCIQDNPVLMPEFTLAPKATETATPTGTPTPTPTETPVAAKTPDPGPSFDALGAKISGLGHYTQYLYFRNIQIYEQHEDSFFDAIIYNAYPETIICAITLNFYEDPAASATPPQGGWTDEPVASAALQTRDGQYVLKLAPGETTVFAQINTDMTLTDMRYTLTFDETLGIYPG